MILTRASMIWSAKQVPLATAICSLFSCTDCSYALESSSTTAQVPSVVAHLAAVPASKSSKNRLTLPGAPPLRIDLRLWHTTSPHSDPTKKLLPTSLKTCAAPLDSTTFGEAPRRERLVRRCASAHRARSRKPRDAYRLGWRRTRARRQLERQ